MGSHIIWEGHFIEMYKGVAMNIFEFCKWWWNRYFEHLKEVELISAKNWRELCVTKLKEMDKRLMDNGIM